MNNIYKKVLKEWMQPRKNEKFSQWVDRIRLTDPIERLDQIKRSILCKKLKGFF